MKGYGSWVRLQSSFLTPSECAELLERVMEVRYSDRFGICRERLPFGSWNADEFVFEGWREPVRVKIWGTSYGTSAAFDKPRS